MAEQIDREKNVYGSPGIPNVESVYPHNAGYNPNINQVTYEEDKPSSNPVINNPVTPTVNLNSQNNSQKTGVLNSKYLIIGLIVAIFITLIVIIFLLIK